MPIAGRVDNVEGGGVFHQVRGIFPTLSVPAKRAGLNERCERATYPVQFPGAALVAFRTFLQKSPHCAVKELESAVEGQGI